MNFSAIFIYRPVATSLLTLAIALAGMLAFLNLPVASIPQVDYPTIVVQTSLPGASAETMAATVATPLERALGHIAGITEMTSASSQGATHVTLQFDPDRDIYGAGRDVQAAINSAASLLPTGMPTRPGYRRENPADSPIMIIALTSDTLDRVQIYDIATTLLAPKLSQITGISQVQVSGAALKAVRLELNPDALSKYGLGLEDVRNTISQGNVNRPKGVLENDRQRWQIQANDQARTAEDYKQMIVSYRNHAPVRIGDLGEAIDSIEDLRNIGLKNGKLAVLLMLKKQPSANVIATVDQITALLPELKASIPDSIEMSPVQDHSRMIRASIREVELSLAGSVILVMMVVLLFLRDMRSTLIPLISLPVSLLAACMVMYFCRYSLNNLTVMALIIATGFVVDDAIVVVENCRRHIEAGMQPFKAALRAAQEVGFTVLAMSLSLVAVFVPILLMGGVVGRMFREFAVTLSIAVLVSLLISLTTTPMLCARWLRKDNPPPGGFFRLVARGINGMQSYYESTLTLALEHRRIILAILLAAIAMNVFLYNIINKGFFPTQDTGRLNGSLLTDQNASFYATQKKLYQFSELIKQDPAVRDVVGYAGGGVYNSTAYLNVTLFSHDERPPIDQVMERLRQRFARIPGARLFLFPDQELRIGGRPPAGLFEYALQSDDLDLLQAWTPKIVAALAKLPELKDVNSNLQDKGQRIDLQVNREMALRYGVTQAMIDASLYDAFGQRQVSVIYNPLNQNKVVMELAPEYWQSSDILDKLYISVPGALQADGALAPARQVPLSAVAAFAPANMPLRINHQGQFAT
ncbi:MAG: efflux RND transporter permease subunit, partial [Methylomonas sp.]